MKKKRRRRRTEPTPSCLSVERLLLHRGRYYGYCLYFSLKLPHKPEIPDMYMVKPDIITVT
jgi:hypothetical protein